MEVEFLRQLADTVLLKSNGCDKECFIAVGVEFVTYLERYKLAFDI